jgi:hypothetical protein
MYCNSVTNRAKKYNMCKIRLFYIDNKTWIGFPLVIIATFFVIGIDVIQLQKIFIIGAIS